MNIRKCTWCLKEKDVSNFSRLDIQKGGYRTFCDDCNKSKNKHIKNLKKRFPCPTNPKYHCPVCDEPLETFINRGYTQATWYLDHNHKTGEFEGYLCKMCNFAKGNLRDSIENAERMASYLKGELDHLQETYYSNSPINLYEKTK